MHETTLPARLTPHDERRVAVAAGCDPRTIRAYLDPARRSRIRSPLAGRIGETLRALGLAPAADAREAAP